MPAADSPEGVLAALAANGGNVAELSALAISDSAATLQSTLKGLGYTKLGERARIIAALRAMPPPSEQGSAEHPAGAVDVTESPARGPALAEEQPSASDGDGTMVMHGAVLDVFQDGGLLKTVLRAGEKGTKPPPQLSRCKVRYIASVLPDGYRFEATVKTFQMGEGQVRTAVAS